LVTDCHSLLASWRNRISQLLNVHWVNDIRPTEIHTAEPLVPEPSAFGIKIAIKWLKGHKRPGMIKSQQNWLQQTVEIHKLIISIWNKEKLN